MKKKKGKSREIISACGRVPATETESKKVTDMVGTFLNYGKEGLQKIRITTIQAESKKVPSTVGTFLNKDRDGFRRLLRSIMAHFEIIKLNVLNKFIYNTVTP